MSRRRAGRAADLLVSAPDRLAVLVLCLALPLLGAVLLGALRPTVVLAAALVLAVLTWPLVPPAAARHTVLDRWAVVAVVLGAAVWAAVGLAHVADYVVVNRDPGFLALEGLWLREHPQAAIPVGAVAGVEAAVPTAHAGTEAFTLRDGSLDVQGTTMVPALLAALGWVGGPGAVLGGNVVVGAVALLAVFAVGRRHVGSGWALVPTAALALCLPFLVFTRAPYTEPLVVALLFGGLSLLHGALGAPARGRAALAGVMLGAAAAVRIDGALLVIGLALALAVGAVLTPRPGRPRAVRSALVVVGCAAAVGALGVLDVLVLSPAYARQQEHELRPLLVGTAVVLGSVLVVLALARRLGSVRRAVDRHRGPLAVTTAALVVVGGAVLASRPLWLVERRLDPAGGAAFLVGTLQRAAGVPVDPARSYDEQTMTWLAWYLGWPAVAAGVLGIALLVRHSLVRRDVRPLVLASVVTCGSLLYLLRASITPDQVWAARRFLPAAIPGVLLGAAYLLAALWRRRERWARPAAAVLATAVLVVPPAAWDGAASVRDLAGRRAQAQEVCAVLDAHHVARVVWVHSSPFRYLATLRVLCDVEVVELLEPATPAVLAAVRAAWGPGDVAALSFDPDRLPWAGGQGAPFAAVSTTELARSVVGRPQGVVTARSAVHGGTVDASGHVVAFD